MVKLLLDANISYRIIKKISDVYAGSVHVTKTGLPIPAKDTEIWSWAKNNGFMLVTNDDDFENLLYFNGFPPKVIMLHTGNQSTQFVATLLLTKQHEIEQFNNTAEFGLLEFY